MDCHWFCKSTNAVGRISACNFCTQIYRQWIQPSGDRGAPERDWQAIILSLACHLRRRFSAILHVFSPQKKTPEARFFQGFFAFSWSERQDLNLRPLDPQSRVMCHHYGISALFVTCTSLALADLQKICGLCVVTVWTQAFHFPLSSYSTHSTSSWPRASAACWSITAGRVITPHSPSTGSS